MKPFQVAILSLILLLSISYYSTYSYGAPELVQASKVSVSLILRFRNYATDMPIANTSITATTSLPNGGQKQIPLTPTNETGIIQVSLGIIDRPTQLTPSRLLSITLSNNYTLVKVENLFIEDMQYTGNYIPNVTRYTGLQINLNQKDLGTQIIIEGNLWVLKGELIRISDHEPLAGEKVILSVKPGMAAVIQKTISEYEGYYFLPLNYEVTVYPQKNPSNYKTYPRIYQKLKVTVGENTTFNWIYNVAKIYADTETSLIQEEMEWLRSSGHPLDREVEEFQAVKSLLDRVLDLYQREEYGPALGGASISEKRLGSLKSWLSNLKTLAMMASVSISLFTYGLASLLSIFFFEEPSENKIRLGSKVLVFSLLMLIFSLTHPSLKITYAIMINSKSIDLPVSLLGCFILGSITYFFIELVSIKKSPMTDLALQLGMRSLKRRISRTILTLVTITVIVSSAMVFVNISAERTTRVKDSWKGTNIQGVLIRQNLFGTPTPLTEYDINWTREQEWCEELGHMRKIWARGEYVGDSEILRDGVLTLGTNTLPSDIVVIDPGFMEKYYGLSEYVRGFWQEFLTGNAVAVVSSSLAVPTNEYVTLGVEEYLHMPSGEVVFRGTKTLGEFRVVGIFDPIALSNLTNIDGYPLFDDPSNMVLIPLSTKLDLSVFISEVTVISAEGFDPVKIAEEMAYTFGMPVTASKDGFAMKVEWGLELSAAGLIPYLPPLVIAGLMMYVTMASVYEERRREFVTLATLGLDPRNTFEVFLVEALLLGLMGTFFGFFGSYILAVTLFYTTSLLGVYGVQAFSFSYGNWSMLAILVALFTGVVMVFLGGYIPAVRTQGLSLMGRVKRRQLIGELVSEGDVTSFSLPIRENIQNGEMLYTFARETLGKFKRSLVDSHSVKGEMYGDGSFKVSFVSMDSGQATFVPCEIKGVRDGETLVSVIEFPTRFRDYGRIREIMRELEGVMLGFSAWKEMQLKMNIVREAPREQKTVEEILTEVQSIIDQIKDCTKKLKILEAQRGKLSEEIYGEFKQKYIGIIEEKSKEVRSVAIGLEPHSNELQEEIKKTNIEIERVTTAYSLGEISEEDYVRTCSPLQARMAMLKSKVNELEEIFDFLKKPMSVI